MGPTSTGRSAPTTLDPFESLGIVSGAASDPGRDRLINEDAWLATTPVFLVADGMGGHRAGNVASSIVVEKFDALARSGRVDADAVGACLSKCEAAIIDRIEGSVDAAPGTTLVAAIAVSLTGEAYWLIVNIGDSRAYQWADGSLQQLTKDHSVVQELIDAGEITEQQAHLHPERHVITRALGALEDSPADYSLIPMVAGSRILLCSDGVTSELGDEELAHVLSLGEPASEAARNVVARAVAAGGHDNVTAVVISVLGDADQPEETEGRAHLQTQEEDTIRIRSTRHGR